MTGPCGRAFEWLLKHGVYFPMTYAARRQNATVRLVGVVCFMVWVLPVGALLLLPMFFLLLASLIEDTWYGDV